MISWLKNLFGNSGENFAPSSSLMIEEATRLVDELLQSIERGSDEGPIERGSDEGQEFTDTAMQTLRFLWDRANALAELADGYPRKGGIRADVWSDGVKLAKLGKSLAAAFQGRGMTELEEIATSIWVKATLQVQSHYHHIVGPAMLADADCNERLGRYARASELYEAVIGDFRHLVYEWEDETDYPDEEDALALEALSTALTRRLKLEADADMLEAHRSLLARLESILRRSPDVGT